MKKTYKSTTQHLYDELLLIDLLIHAQVIKFRASSKEQNNKLQGLYISEAEIDALLQESPDYDKWVDKSEDVSDEYEKVTSAIKVLSGKIREKIKNSLDEGIFLKLVYLAELYQLNSLEANILSICLAPEFNSKYRKFVAYLHNDITRKNISVELLLNFVCDTFSEKSEARKIFSIQSPFFKNNILQFIEDRNDKDKPLLSREIKVNQRIVSFLLNDDYIDDELSTFARIKRSENLFNDVVLPEETKEKVSNFISFYKNNKINDNYIFALYGNDENQKIEAASAICNELGIHLLVIDLHALYNSHLYFERGIDLILRESNIMNTAIFLENCDFIFSDNPEIDDESYIKRYLYNEFDQYSRLSFFSSSAMLPLHGKFDNQKIINLELPIPEYAQRKELWNNYLSGSAVDESADIKEISGKYNLTSAQIKDVVKTSKMYALWRDPQNAVVTQKDIEESCHVHSNQRLSKLAQRINPKHKWGDIVLEEYIESKLKEIVKMFKHKHIVYSEWGFDDKLSLGKGISACFFGDPGTGKTLAAEIIANELAMDLYKIDISTVVSKYIGETEKNLSKIFNEAETSNAILFFDEADSLFGKRTEVKDSHDRYANLEVSYLLQRIDEYNGIVIMATNFNQNMDEAFERRLHFIINFPSPDDNSRLLIWKNIFSKKTPLADDIDFEIIAKKLEISGGNIKNIALQSAFYAADNGGIVTMDLLVKACKNEFEKIGRLWDSSLEEKICNV